MKSFIKPIVRVVPFPVINILINLISEINIAYSDLRFDKCLPVSQKRRISHILRETRHKIGTF